MPTSQDLEHDVNAGLPDNFQTGFVQAMLFAQGIVEPTGRDLADAVSALQQYRLVSHQYEGGVPRYHGVSRTRRATA